MVPVVLEQAEANLPTGRIGTLADDTSAESDDVHGYLFIGNAQCHSSGDDLSAGFDPAGTTEHVGNRDVPQLGRQFDRCLAVAVGQRRAGAVVEQ
jgi:hypothetical protein